MLNLDVFLPRLLPSVPGCPDPTARQALLDSAIEFCEETALVRITTDPQVAAGVSVYEVEVPLGQKVAITQRAWYGRQELMPAMSSMVSNVDAYTFVPSDPNQVPHSFLESAPGEITLFPAPGVLATGQVTFRAATKPSRSATSVADVLYEDWAEAIVAGALKRLHAIPDTPYFSDNHAIRRAAEFQLGINRARAEAQRGRVRGSITTAPRRFA